uniref:Uncharacterized protein n=1 Tax=uncultured Bacillota bacterium TaxID=344338 RepID=A0A650EP09_9FIRM|nr:hypothetical protein Firmicute1046_2480 [uncultured Firmicutes bacterium]
MGEMSKQVQKMVCPKCGSDRLQITTESNTQTSGKNYSSGQGCLGYLMFGPLGLLCGSCGQKQKTTVTNTDYWLCPDCGNKFRNPDDIKADISKKSKIASFPMLLVLLALAAFIIGLGIWLDTSVLKVFGIICAIIYILAWIVTKTWVIPKAKKELSDIEEGMAKFR